MLDVVRPVLVKYSVLQAGGSICLFQHYSKPSSQTEMHSAQTGNTEYDVPLWLLFVALATVAHWLCSKLD
jgi:hypothetical protein